ncbi:unnamed protein product [Oncorhynchus mykiss]|uniref:Vitellinogen open beta-sheet domain-containing protein n=1 Tax=Oncorhynchus mykiss TaxID=8022 RepID=A0A060X305_ONCMY|nr:unnamed protein product [Oncorhynchus mykiss]
MSSRFASAFESNCIVFSHFTSLMMGAAPSAFYINDAATIFPRAIVAKARTYFAGAAADVLEIGVRTEGIQEALMKIPKDPKKS